MQKLTIKALIATTASMLALSAVAQNTHTDSTSSEIGASSPGVTTTTTTTSSSSTDKRSATRYVDDKTISTKINAKYLVDEDLKSRHLKVRTYKGVVHLSGYTTSHDQADHAVAIAKDIDGVKSVKSSIQVKADN
jgi:hyperosmotically inducible periplasmic protein